MVTVDDAVIARMDKDGKHFEVLVDPETAYALREGKSVSVAKMLAVNQVFSDAKKGMRASDGDVLRLFSTHDVAEIAETIVKKGEIQLTTDFRRKKADEKKRQVAAFIAQYATNPQTKLPHPLERILSAMDQAHVSIDAMKPVDQQIETVVKALKSIMPLSMDEVTLDVHVPAQYSGRVYGSIKDLGRVAKDQWLGDGSLAVQLVIPAGMKDAVFHKLNKLTDGTTKIETR